MTGARDTQLLRVMTMADVPRVLDVQEPGAVRGLAEIFPQDAFPFPRNDVGERWRCEIQDPSIGSYVIMLEELVAGFVAIRNDELLHFGIAVEHWGSGLASEAHDAVLNRFVSRGIHEVWLNVFTHNWRARRFYERRGWLSTGERTLSSFPPHPELLRYTRRTDDSLT